MSRGNLVKKGSAFLSLTAIKILQNFFIILGDNLHNLEYFNGN
jgi:hypothetical protein